METNQPLRRTGDDAKACWRDLERLWAEHGWTWFDHPKKPFLLNLFALRNPASKVNVFNDYLGLVYRDATMSPVVDLFEATTEPGRPHMVNPIHPGGAGAIARGQYLNAYEVGPFREWDVLKQVRKVQVHRDSSRNALYDWHDTTELGWGFFIHPRSIRMEMANKGVVGGSSAGCIVTKEWSDWEVFWEIISDAARLWDRAFTLTVLGMEELSDDVWRRA